MRYVGNGLRFVVVTGGIIVLTSLGIDASQYLTGSTSALGILADRATEGACPEGMTFVERGPDDFCIDTYEAVPAATCPHRQPDGPLATLENLTMSSCNAVSRSVGQPWVYVTYHQAVELCARTGKRLPTHDEWYAAAVGTAEATCTVAAREPVSGKAGEACRSGAGVSNMIGNVWEWVAGDITGRTYGTRALPPTGYVANADSAGVATETSSDPQPVFREDYFWSKDAGTYVMMRGGFYGSGDDAGVYSIHADIEPNFAGAAVGFRCVQAASV